MFHECMENLTYVYGSDHLLVAPQYFSFARILQARGRAAASISLLLEGIRISREAQGEAWKDAAKRWDQLARTTKRIARAAGLAQKQYQAALRGATTLSSRPAEGASYQGLVGIIHYRLGGYDKAIGHLTAQRKPSAGDVPDELRERAFLAMAQFHLGEIEAARDTLAGVHELMQRESLANDETNRAVVAEAVALISSEDTAK